MIRSCRQGSPVGFGHKVRIAAAGWNCRCGTPEAVGVFCVEAADDGIRVAGPEQGEQPSRFFDIQFAILREVTECASVLLAGVLGPKQAYFGLIGSADGAVTFSENADLIVVVFPFFTGERRGAAREKLRSAAHRERAHLAEPWRERGQKLGRSRLPDPGATAGCVGDIGFERSE